MGLQHLVEAIKLLENVLLVIRIRDEQDECNLHTLKTLVPLSLNIEFSTSVSFKDDLDRSDLLVSFSSTAIEEALYARKPVGLFGGSDRYRHLPGSREFPSIECRSAVYHLSKHNLSEMLNQIVKVHKNTPLTENEIKPYVWENNVVNREDFIKKL